MYFAPSNPNRVILHIDINSCFASCEQQDHPSWRGKPLGVVQDTCLPARQGGKRGVIISSSIEAKQLGIGTGDLVWEAKKIYSDIILTPANFERYAHYSRLFRQICFDYSYRVEVFSIDELFMDITKTNHLFGGPIKIAMQLKKRLKTEVGDWLNCSIGIAPNKMLAKLASSSDKPDGLIQVDYKNRLKFLDQHPLWHICGIASRIQCRLNRLGIYTIPQMRQADLKILTKEFGVLGKIYYHWAYGEDFSPVNLSGQVGPDKSYGNQMTLPAETTNEAETLQVIFWLCWQVAHRLRVHGAAAKTASLYIRRKDTSAHGQTSSIYISNPHELYRTIKHLYHHKLNWSGPIKFAGVSTSNLIPLSPSTLPVFAKEQKQRLIASAWDDIASRYGTFHLRPASLLYRNLKQTNLNGFTKKF